MKLTLSDREIINTLLELLQIPSPTGYTDQIVHHVGDKLRKLGIEVEITRRGAIRANLHGQQKSPDRAIIAHVDTLGAMVKELKSNGRLAISPIGHWNARFAEGARVTIFTDKASVKGTILPLKASGHTFNKAIDSQPVAWENVEVRVDEFSHSKEDLINLGFHVGDFIGIDPQPEFSASGFINSRHLDNKAGVTALLCVAKMVQEHKLQLPVDCHLLFTISEETGSGASAVLHGDVAEIVSIDNSTPAPGQNSIEDGVTIGIMDSSGPFDYHLTHKLIDLCEKHSIRYARDVFKYYRTDAASALEAGNDIRTSLVCFGVDASHGWERTHINSIRSVADLLLQYVQSPPTFSRDRYDLGPLTGFSTQHL